MTCEATAWVRMWQWLAGMAASVFRAEYFACTGQIGMQLELPSHRLPHSDLPGAGEGLGQIGMELELPSHRLPRSGSPAAPTGRYPLPPSYFGLGIELRACGTLVSEIS